MRSPLLLFIVFSLFAGPLAAADTQPESYWADYLRAMKEPSLSSAKVANGDFQFRWTRLSGSREPLSIRVWQDHGRTFARSVRLEYKLDFSLGRITRDQTIVLSDGQLKQLRTSFATATFWRPFNQTEKVFEGDFLGGAHWLFEIRDPSGYRFISMFSPPLFLRDANPPKIPKGTRNWQPYVNVATFLLRTTKIFPDEHEAYY